MEPFRVVRQCMMRKGLSNVLIMVLLIVFVLIAIGILWFYLSTFLRSGSSTYDTSSCLTVDLKATECVYTLMEDQDLYHITVLLKRGTDTIPLRNANLILTDAAQNARSISWNGSERVSGTTVPNTLEQSLAIFALPSFPIAAVAAAPIVGDSLHVCAPSQSPTLCLPYTYTPGDVCGDYNLNGQVDFFDYLDFIRCYMHETGQAPDPNACSTGLGTADVDNDGDTDTIDYGLFVAANANYDSEACVY